MTADPVQELVAKIQHLDKMLVAAIRERDSARRCAEQERDARHRLSCGLLGQDWTRTSTMLLPWEVSESAPRPTNYESRWLTFKDAGASPSGKTRRWEVVTKQGGTVIGRVEWYSGWRRYVLRPAYPTEWERDCLRDVAAFLDARTAEQKASAKP